jgi:hypothetical protein
MLAKLYEGLSNIFFAVARVKTKIYLQPRPTEAEAKAVCCPSCQGQPALFQVQKENGNCGRWFYKWCEHLCLPAFFAAFCLSY